MCEPFNCPQCGEAVKPDTRVSMVAERKKKDEWQVERDGVNYFGTCLTCLKRYTWSKNLSAELPLGKKDAEDAVHLVIELIKAIDEKRVNSFTAI